jgi:exosortase E/protease (VPEID-CTERM system)
MPAIPTWNRFGALRWGGTLALFLFEAWAVSYQLRFGRVAGVNDALWAKLAGHVPTAVRILVVALAVTTILAWRPLRDELKKHSDLRQQAAWPWPIFLIHLAVLAAYLWLTARLLDSDAIRAFWILLWAALGLASVASLALIVFPFDAWLLFARRCWKAAAAGVGLGAIAFVAGQYTVSWWLPLCDSTIWLARLLLGLVTNDVVCQPDKYLLGTSLYQGEIEPACSGYEGIGLIWVFLAGYLWFRRSHLRFPHALLLLPLGTVLIWFANGVRLAALILIGSYWSPDIAERGFHSQAGWLAFNGVALGLVALSVRLDLFRKCDEVAPDVAPDAELSNPAAPYLVPFLVLMATLMVCAAFSSGFDYLYPVRVLTVGAALLWFFADYRRWPWGWSWHAVALGIVVFALWLLLEPLREAVPAEGPFSRAVGMSPLVALVWLVCRIVGSVVIVPLAEELAFRGFLIRRLQASDFEKISFRRFTWLSFVVSSVLFGMLHSRWLAGSLAGMLFALALYRRGRLADAVLAHATANALLAAYVIPTGAWSLWT